MKIDKRDVEGQKTEETKAHLTISRRYSYTYCAYSARPRCRLPTIPGREPRRASTGVGSKSATRIQNIRLKELFCINENRFITQ